ncbi:MAG: phage antirepressor N-terminal domain-containing protein, partial [Candidatus Promineifilaceae bacterium]
MTAIVVQKSVEMYGDEITAIQADDDQIYVSITNMCNALGLKPQPARNRIKRHKVMREGLVQVQNLQTAGGLQPGYVLRMDLVPMWLASIQVSSVKEELQDKLYKLQLNAAKILWEAFRAGELTVEEDFNVLLEQDTPAVDAYKTALALVKL